MRQAQQNTQTEAFTFHVLLVFTSKRTLSLSHGYPEAPLPTALPLLVQTETSRHVAHQKSVANLTKSTLSNLVKQQKVAPMLRLSSYSRWQQRYYESLGRAGSGIHFLHL